MGFAGTKAAVTAAMHSLYAMHKCTKSRKHSKDNDADGWTDDENDEGMGGNAGGNYNTYEWHHRLIDWATIWLLLFQVAIVFHLCCGHSYLACLNGEPC